MRKPEDDRPNAEGNYRTQQNFALLPDFINLGEDRSRECRTDRFGGEQPTITNFTNFLFCFLSHIRMLSNPLIEFLIFLSVNEP